MAGGLYDDITQKLEHNGGITDKEFRWFVVMALRDIGRGVEKINKLEDRVEALEESSILLLAKKYPKIAGAVGIAFLGVFAATVWHLGLLTWLLKLVGIPVP